MIGMGFGAFLTLFIISLIAAAVIHYAIRYRYLKGVDGFLAKWIVGWVGAWIASPVLGHWFGGVAISSQFIIPAFLGAFSVAFMMTAACKAMAGVQSASVEYAQTVTARSSSATQMDRESKIA